MEHITHDDDDAKPTSDHTDYGFKTVNTKLKTGLIHELFSEVADKYDFMNDVMSLGLHRRWKRALIDGLDLRPGMQILDVAGGTGDIGLNISMHKAYLHPNVTVCDLTYSMLHQGRMKAINSGQLAINWHAGNAERLPYADATFDRVIIAFGLRNITNKPQALAEMARVLKPDGKWFCLEFSPPDSGVSGLLQPLYNLYSLRLIPLLGGVLAKNRDAYRYLVESIRRFPSPEILQSMILQHGFTSCTYQQLAGGIVSLHKAQSNVI